MTGRGTPAGPGATITISLEIDNTYPGQATIHTRITGAVVTAPPGPAGAAAALHDWAFEHLMPLTGTGGTTSGDGYYVAVVTACTDPQLLGRIFTFGD